MGQAEEPLGTEGGRRDGRGDKQDRWRVDGFDGATPQGVRPDLRREGSRLATLGEMLAAYRIEKVVTKKDQAEAPLGHHELVVEAHVREKIWLVIEPFDELGHEVRRAR